MGKGSKGFGGKPGASGAFVHKASTGKSQEKSSKVTRNVKFLHHGTKERKVGITMDLKVKNLENRVTKQKALMRTFGGFDGTDLRKEAPNFNLIGPARAALQHYLPKLPGYKPPVESKNLLGELSGGKMWSHEEGRKLLLAMHDHAVCLHNLLSKTRQAITICNEMIEMDPEDHLRARYSLLRIYLDDAMGEQARELVQVRFPHDRSALFAFSLALLEHISHAIINESGSSEETKNIALSRAGSHNPYLLFMLANLSHFQDGIFEFTDKIVISAGDSSDYSTCNGNSGSDSIESSGSSASSSSSSNSNVNTNVDNDNNDEDDKYLPVPGSIEEAIAFMEADSELWLDTDGAIEWVDSFCNQDSMCPQLISASASSGGKKKQDKMMGSGVRGFTPEAMLQRVDEDIAKRNRTTSSKSNKKDMFLLMFKTGVELLLDE